MEVALLSNLGGEERKRRRRRCFLDVSEVGGNMAGEEDGIHIQDLAQKTDEMGLDVFDEQDPASDRRGIID
jgi:hypothetical protein